MDPQTRTLTLSGDWTAVSVARWQAPRIPSPSDTPYTLDTRAIGHMDTAGAWALHRYLRSLQAAGVHCDESRAESTHRALLKLVSERGDSPPPAAPPREGGLTQIGRKTMESLHQSYSLFSFAGETLIHTLPVLLQPWRIRWKQVIAEIQLAGVQALGIVGLLSFLIGMVIAYQGGATLQQYGANILIVNMVAIVTLREMAPLITAILVAGRTGSSYAAQLGTMKVTEEIDALRTLAISPLEMLVLPKVLALFIALPLLTVYADIMGLLGGAVVAGMIFDVPLSLFLQRLPEVVSGSTFWVGVVKAPVFALTIALIGCHQGFLVQGSAAAVGRATTVSVVQAIFTVIVLDALFSILFNKLDL